MNYCSNCPRRTGTYVGSSGAVGTAGSPRAAICLVGMSPGKEELVSGEPFVGSSGRLLWSIGRDVGLFRPDAWIFNTASCWPCGAKGKNLTVEQIEACTEYFTPNLMAFQGTVLVCLGVEAFDAVTGLVTWERAMQKDLRTEDPDAPKKQIGIANWRGYLVRPEDTVPVIRSREVRGSERYQMRGKCPVCKGIPNVVHTMMHSTPIPSWNPPAQPPEPVCWYCCGTGTHVKGDYKLVTERYEVPRELPPNLKYIIGTYHPSFIMRTGMKTLGAFINDLGRAMDAVHDTLSIVEVRYETEVPA
jgi:uracil-DNA glycosylase family 4